MKREKRKKKVPQYSHTHTVHKEATHTHACTEGQPLRPCAAVILAIQLGAYQ